MALVVCIATLLAGVRGLQFASSTQLPSFSESGDVQGRTEALDQDGRWWARVGDKVFHAPPPQTALSQEVSKYYYAVGSHSALPAELRKHRVGGQGRVHLFHLPQGVQELQYGEGLHTGDRKTSVSRLSQLQTRATLHTRFPHYSMKKSYVDPIAALGEQSVKVVARAGAKITSDSVMENVREVSSFFTRSAENATATAEVESWLRGKFTAMGLATCSQNFSTGLFGFRKLPNVVALIRGQTNDTVTVGAHYDSRPYSGPAPGADDNGSGIAALLAIAKAYAESGVVPVKSVYFVAFAGEEQGLLGSEAFAQQLEAPTGELPAECRLDLHDNNTHQALIMDEIGWSSPAEPALTVNLESYDTNGEVMDHLAEANLLRGTNKLDVVHSNNPFGSDHMSWLNRGWPAVLTINGDDENYPGYHSAQDVVANVNGTLLAGIAEMNLGALFRLASVGVLRHEQSGDGAPREHKLFARHEQVGHRSQQHPVRFGSHE